MINKIKKMEKQELVEYAASQQQRIEVLEQNNNNEVKNLEQKDKQIQHLQQQNKELQKQLNSLQTQITIFNRYEKILADKQIEMKKTNNEFNDALKVLNLALQFIQDKSNFNNFKDILQQHNIQLNV